MRVGFPYYSCLVLEKKNNVSVSSPQSFLLVLGVTHYTFIRRLNVRMRQVRRTMKIQNSQGYYYYHRLDT